MAAGDHVQDRYTQLVAQRFIYLATTQRGLHLAACRTCFDLLGDQHDDQCSQNKSRKSMNRQRSKSRSATRAFLRAAVPATLMFVWSPASHTTDAEQPSGDGVELKYAEERQALVRTIEKHVHDTSGYLGRAVLSAPVLEAMQNVPRHEFVPDWLRSRAYQDRPLPIGHDQTISQPYIVAIMTDLLDLPPGCRVLDIGTGSGYQAAILAEICAAVYTIEIVEALGLEARARLERLGYENITVRIGDGFLGWPEQQPFDAIIVAAVTAELPPPLLEQLKPGGHMIIPLHSGARGQQLVLVEKQDDETVTRREILPVRFVPLTGDHDKN